MKENRKRKGGSMPGIKRKQRILIWTVIIAVAVTSAGVSLFSVL